MILPARAILGRAKGCVIILEDPLVSHEHARVSWSERGWEIHDLGSRNGTFIDGRKLESGATAALERGSKIAFGDPRKPYKVIDSLPPQPCARDSETNVLHFAQHGILTLPPELQPAFQQMDDWDTGNYAARAPGQDHRHTPVPGYPPPGTPAIDPGGTAALHPGVPVNPQSTGQVAGPVNNPGSGPLPAAAPPARPTPVPGSEMHHPALLSGAVNPGYNVAYGVVGNQSQRRPMITIFADAHGEWVAEVDGEPKRVQDGMVLAGGGQVWHLHLPQRLEHTQEYALGRTFLGMLDLEFRVGAAREFVELIASHDDRVLLRRSRAFNHLLLATAYARIGQPLVAGENQGPVDPEGWVTVESLCHALQIDENRLAVDIHRARREFASVGVINAPNIIERRRATRQLRIGVARITIRDI